MNKRPSSVTRRGELEKELIGDIEEQKAKVEAGRDIVDTPFSQQAAGATRQFQIRQGIRRKHPLKVLSNFSTITNQTSNAESLWEKALMEDQERVEIPTEYKATDAHMMVNQMGLAKTALDNFTKSKGKFNRQYISGI